MSKARDQYPGRNQCRYICDDGPYVTRSPAWCLKPLAPWSSTYCATHHRACYIPLPKKRDRPIIFQRIAPL